MKCNHVRILALLVALCLPAAVQAAESNQTAALDAAINLRLLEKQPYQKIWKLVNADDGEGLRNYLLSKKEELTANDLMVVRANKKGSFKRGLRGEHIYCHAARENKMKAGKTLVDIVNVPSECLRYPGARVHQKYDDSIPGSGNYIPVEEINVNLACYALEKQQIGFMGQRDTTIDGYRAAAAGKCEAAYVLYRNRQMSFPGDYKLLTGPAWLALSSVRQELVPTEAFQEALSHYISQAKDDAVTKKLRGLVLPNPPVPPAYSQRD